MYIFNILITQEVNIMSFRINTNTSANFANVYGRQTQSKIDKSLERLSTGLRINRAADDK